MGTSSPLLRVAEGDVNPERSGWWIFGPQLLGVCALSFSLPNGLLNNRFEDEEDEEEEVEEEEEKEEEEGMIYPRFSSSFLACSTHFLSARRRAWSAVRARFLTAFVAAAEKVA